MSGFTLDIPFAGSSQGRSFQPDQAASSSDQFVSRDDSPRFEFALNHARTGRAHRTPHRSYNQTAAGHTQSQYADTEQTQHEENGTWYEQGGDDQAKRASSRDEVKERDKPNAGSAHEDRKGSQTPDHLQHDSGHSRASESAQNHDGSKQDSSTASASGEKSKQNEANHDSSSAEGKSSDVDKSNADKQTNAKTDQNQADGASNKQSNQTATSQTIANPATETATAGLVNTSTASANQHAGANAGNANNAQGNLTKPTTARDGKAKAGSTTLNANGVTAETASAGQTRPNGQVVRVNLASNSNQTNQHNAETGSNEGKSPNAKASGGDQSQANATAQSPAFKTASANALHPVASSPSASSSPTTADALSGLIHTSALSSNITASSAAPSANANASTSSAATAQTNLAESNSLTGSNHQTNQARLSRALSNAVQQRGGGLTLRLTPPEMGTVRVQLQLGSGNVSAQFHAETGSAQNMLHQQLGQLRSALENQGLHVDRLSVQSTSHTNPGQPSQHQSGGQSANDGRSRGQYAQTGQQGGQDRGGQQHQREQPDYGANQTFNELFEDRGQGAEWPSGQV